MIHVKKKKVKVYIDVSGKQHETFERAVIASFCAINNVRFILNQHGGLARFLQLLAKSAKARKLMRYYLDVVERDQC